MKNLMFSLMFMLIGSFVYANNITPKVDFEDNYEIKYNNFSDINSKLIVDINSIVMDNYSSITESCTIKSMTQVISNGEVTHTSTIVFHIDGMSCDLFFLLLSMI